MKIRRVAVGIYVMAIVTAILFSMGPSREHDAEQSHTQEVLLPSFSQETSAHSEDPAALRDSYGTPLSPPTQETHARLLRASAAHHYEVLALEIHKPRGELFRFSEGITGNNLAIAFWKEQKKETGRDPLDILHALLGGVPFRKGGDYLWPRWIEKKLNSLTTYEQDEAVLFTGVSFRNLRETGDYYTGPRTAISSEGVWLYFIEGN